MAGSVRDSPLQAEAWRTLAIALTKAQLWEQALSAWEEAKAVNRMISDAEAKEESILDNDRALHQLMMMYLQAQQWERAETLARMMEHPYGIRDNALCELAIALAQAQQWERAEAMAYSLDREEKKIKALTEIAQILAASGDDARLLDFVQRAWLRAKKRADAFAFLPLATNLMHRYPDICIHFYQAIIWDKTFLRESISMEQV